MLGAELAQQLDKALGHQLNPAALEGLGHDGRDVVRVDAVVLERGEEVLEADRIAVVAARLVGPLVLKRIGERNLHERGVGRDNPVLCRRRAACLLRAHRAAMEAVVKGHDDALGCALGKAVGLGQLDGALGALGAGAQKEDAVVGNRDDLGDLLDQMRALLVREDIAVNQAVRNQIQHCLLHIGVAVAGVGHDDAGGEVDPAVIDVVADGLVPNDGRLAGHGGRLVPAHFLENLNRLRRRNLRFDGAVLCIYLRNILRLKRKVCHNHFLLAMIANPGNYFAPRYALLTSSLFKRSLHLPLRAISPFFRT